MVQRTNKNIKLAIKLKKKISKFIEVDKFILFGSRAKGNFRKDSDFDVLVISKDFKGVIWYRRPLKIYLSWEEDYPLEVLCYTPQEIKDRKANKGIIFEAVETGIEV